LNGGTKADDGFEADCMDFSSFIENHLSRRRWAAHRGQECFAPKITWRKAFPLRGPAH
jgi:hypothetical protein